MTGLELYFAGGEVPTWRKLLIAERVPHVAINYRQLKERASKGWRLADHFPDSQSIFVDSGAFGINKSNWSVKQQEEFLGTYLDFVQTNLDRLAFFTECDFTDRGLDWVQRQRASVWADLAPAKFVPVWHEEWGAPVLRAMVEECPNLGVPSLPTRTQNALGSVIRRTRVGLHGLSFSHPYSLSPGLYTSIVSSSWISPMRFGETVVWDHNRLRRYSAEEKTRIRRRYRTLFNQQGFDGERMVNDDNAEVARYTIWAWRQMEESLEGPQRMRVLKRVTHSGSKHPSRSPALEVVPVDHSNGSARVTGTQSDGQKGPTKPIPVFDFRQVKTQMPSPDGLSTTESTTSVPVLTPSGLRKCDSCSLAPVCPEHSPGADCRYSIPIEIRNREQLMAILSALLEMQGQRIAFAFMSEQLAGGGYPDANLSSELDRFMRMTESVKNIQDNRDFLKVTVEGRGEIGVLRRLFGADRAASLGRVDPERAEDAIRRTLT